MRTFTDYVQPNLQVAQKHMDVNYFQTKPYLDELNKARGTDLVTIAAVHVEPFGAYSKKIKDIADLPEGAQVAIPNDPSNTGRALLLLEKHGLIKLKDGVGLNATPRDVVDNPKKLHICELESATLPRVLNQVDPALINTNYALQTGLKPTKDALLIEEGDSPYVNYLVTRPDNANSEAMQKLVNMSRRAS